jgi:hypothetical protein
MIESAALQTSQLIDQQAIQGQQIQESGNPGSGADGRNSSPVADSAEALSIAKNAYAGETTPSGPTSAERLLARLDSMDREFVKSMTSMPEVNTAEAGSPEGLMKLSTELLRHQASMTQASIGVSMISAGTTSFRDGVKQVLTQQ